MRILLFKRTLKSSRILKSHENFVNSQSYSYIDAMYNAWLKDPASVHVSWNSYFNNLKNNSPQPFQAPPTLIPSIKLNTIPSGEIMDTMKVQLMVRAYQVRGHQLANLDPLGINFVGAKEAPELTIEHYGFTEKDLDRKFYLGAGILPAFIANENGQEKTQKTLKEIVHLLRETYCGSIGIEYGHINDRKQCDWLRQRFEVPRKINFPKEKKISILDRLTWSDHFERFVSIKYPSEKRFGLEGKFYHYSTIRIILIIGCESLIPGMKAIIDASVELGANNLVMGMPHRGRLNVLANVVRKSHASIFNEFAGSQDNFVEGSGDVKYHLGMVAF